MFSKTKSAEARRSNLLGEAPLHKCALNVASNDIESLELPGIQLDDASSRSQTAQRSLGGGTRSIDERSEETSRRSSILEDDRVLDAGGGSHYQSPRVDASPRSRGNDRNFQDIMLINTLGRCQSVRKRIASVVSCVAFCCHFLMESFSLSFSLFFFFSWLN